MHLGWELKLDVFTSPDIYDDDFYNLLYFLNNVVGATVGIYEQTKQSKQRKQAKTKQAKQAKQS